MVLSLLVAKITALVFLSAGLAALSGKMDFEKMVHDFERSPALCFITGFISIVIGMLLVGYHNFWVMNWTVLITIIGWAAVIKGIMFIAAPGSIASFKGMFKNTKAWGILLIIIGILFGYLGVFM